MLRNIVTVLLVLSHCVSALVVPTDKPTGLLSLENSLFVHRADPPTLQARALTIRKYYTPAMKRSGACVGMLFSAFVVALNIALA